MKQILMLHGWGFPGAVYTSLMDKLGFEFDARSADRPGYGSNVEKDDWSATTRLEAPALLVGWSLGGQLALQLALRQPEMVTGLVLLATTPCFVNRPDWSSGMDNEVFDAFRKRVLDDPASAMQQFVRLNTGHRPDRQSSMALSNLSRKVTPHALQQGMTELAETDLRDAVAEIRVPVLLLHAADDRVVPATASSWLQENLPNAERSEFPSGGHAFFLQQTDKVAGHIRAMA